MGRALCARVKVKVVAYALAGLRRDAEVKVKC